MPINVQVRPLERKDYDNWHPLWQANCLNQISDEVTTETWRRLTNPKENVYGLGVFYDENRAYGFLHYILHPVTGFTQYACYMQDLYIDSTVRRSGYAKRLIWDLNEMGKNENWARIYWFAENDNIAAQNLYKTLGISMNFSLHMLSTQE